MSAGAASEQNPLDEAMNYFEKAAKLTKEVSVSE